MKKLIQKILDIQAGLDVPKNRWNDFGGYHYRSCEDVLQALKPLLIEQDILQTLTDEVLEINGEAYVKATVTVTDGEDTIHATAYAREQQSRKKMDAAQLTGTASSYARKYALNGMWNIDDVKDPDTGAHNSEGGNDDGNKSTGDDKEWLNESDKDRWMKAEQWVKEGNNPSRLRDKYKVSKKDMSYFEKLHKDAGH